MYAPHNNTSETAYTISRLFRENKTYKNHSQLFIDWTNDKDGTGKKQITEHGPVAAVAVTLKPQAAADRT